MPRTPGCRSHRTTWLHPGIPRDFQNGQAASKFHPCLPRTPPELEPHTLTYLGSAPPRVTHFRRENLSIGPSSSERRWVPPHRSLVPHATVGH